jgi:hypothetical protein
VGLGGFRVLACADTESEDPPLRALVFNIKSIFEKTAHRMPVTMDGNGHSELHKPICKSVSEILIFYIIFIFLFVEINVLNF